MGKTSKFLIACDTLPENPWERDRLPAIRQALAGRSYEIIDIYEFNSREEAHIIHRSKGAGPLYSYPLEDINQGFLERVYSSGCNILVLGTVDNFSRYLFPETIEKLQNDGVFVVGILGDDEFTKARNRYYVAMFDRVVAYVKSISDEYNSLLPGSCYYLPNSCWFEEPDFERLQIMERDKQHDVIMVGAPFEPRLRLVRALHFAGVKVSLFGSQRWMDDPISKLYYKGFIPSEEFDATIRLSKIVLAPLEDHLSGAMHMNTKIWEAVRNAQFCITSHYQPLVDDYGLDPDNDIVLYESTDDLVSKARYYLDHPEERRTKARRLFERIKADYNYVEMYKKLFDHIEEEVNIKKDNNFAPIITIVNTSGKRMSDSYFPVINLPRTRLLRHRYWVMCDQQINTPYVIHSARNNFYSPYLNKLIFLFPEVMKKGKVRISPQGIYYHDMFLGKFNADLLVWQRKAFLKDYVNNPLPRIIHAMNTHIAFSPLRLCRVISDKWMNKVYRMMVRLFINAK